MGKYAIANDFSKYQKTQTEKFKAIGVSLPESLVARVESAAAKEFVSKSCWVRNTILAQLKHLDSTSEASNG
jgi:metal-responsive CopG/Arc/MetJ family transcriptional regulator